MKSQIAQTSKGPIEYTLLGNGPFVLICHGTSSNCFSTAESQPLVTAGFSVLTPSRPGYGRTPLEVGNAAQAAEAMVALIDSLQIQTCSVLAISGGGPTGFALAAGYPGRVERLVLAAAVSRPDERPNEPAYKNQAAFYGPMHNVIWGLLGLMSRLSPRAMARQTLVIFSTHDPAEDRHYGRPREFFGFTRLDSHLDPGGPTRRELWSLDFARCTNKNAKHATQLVRDRKKRIIINSGISTLISPSA